ncbi:hypothetical protein HDU83_002881 [Entophlyctis luteolus]|nr:hypothetical protein HDU83_002881 [Entophlyctis luteolus]
MQPQDPTQADSTVESGGMRPAAPESVAVPNAQNTAAAHQYTNRLISAKSSYLQQHAHNPVDWYPWGEEAFRVARTSAKPIFLSVGYSTCHWCHAMAHECFENAQIAKLMNRWFVCVKVDREELPSVDQTYMAYLESTTGEGGWPISAFLTPSLKPFFAGTYFAAVAKFGRPDFATVLRNAAWYWKTDHVAFMCEISEEFEGLRDSVAAATRMPSYIPADFFTSLKYAQKTFLAFKESFDWRYGGFGEAPKFPRVPIISFLLTYYHATKLPDDIARDIRNRVPVPTEKLRRCARQLGVDVANVNKKFANDMICMKLMNAHEDALHALFMAEFTLQKILDGGIHDHVGHGYHRFEKMLYDQAQLLSAFTDCFLLTKKDIYAKAANDIILYVKDRLLHPGGVFYAAEDADSYVSQEPAEGSFYVWTAAEIESAVGNGSGPILCFHFGISSEGNVCACEDESGHLAGKNVLIKQHGISETAQRFGTTEDEIDAALRKGLAALQEYRDTRRQRPHRDEKVLAGWNGQMISGLAKASRAFADPELLQLALGAAAFVRSHMYEEQTGRLHRILGAPEIPTTADDYAFFVDALIELYESTFDDSWLKLAVDLQSKMDRTYWDDESGGYFGAAKDEPGILVRFKEGTSGARGAQQCACRRFTDTDKAEATASSMAAHNLMRFDALLGSPLKKNPSKLSFGERCRKIFSASYLNLSQLPRNAPYMMGQMIHSIKGMKKV